MTDAVTGAFAARLKKNLRRIASWRRDDPWSRCFRAFDKDMPELPLSVDVYVGEDKSDENVVGLHVVAFAPRHGGGSAFAARVDACATIAADIIGVELGASSVTPFAQVREPGRGGELDGADVDAAALTLTVREGPARFIVRLGARRDPGLFLDHRVTRRMVAKRVAERAANARVLNLFAYTGSFSVHAALAGAKATTSVDLSASTVRWAEENLAANNLAGPAHRVVMADALSFDDVADADIIVIDPPSFSKSRRAGASFDVARDHPHLITRALTHLAPGGELWFSCNLRDFVLLREALPNVTIVDVTEKTTPPDFRHTPHHCFVVRR